MQPELYWFIPLIFLFMFRGRWRHRDARYGAAERDQIAELEQRNEEQRLRIEDLEARVARVEDGLEFAERVLVERAEGRLQP